MEGKIKRKTFLLYFRENETFDKVKKESGKKYVSITHWINGAIDQRLKGDK